MCDKRLWEPTTARSARDRDHVQQDVDALRSLSEAYLKLMLPIDHDAIARGLLLFSNRRPSEFALAFEHIEKAKLAMKDVEDMINGSKLTYDSLESTEIVYWLLREQWQQAYEVFLRYDSRVKLEDRRSSRPVYHNLRKKIDEKIRDGFIKVPDEQYSQAN
jgi:hypothetical protein